MNKVVIIDYGMGNTDSVKRAVEECGGEPVLSKQKYDLETATHLILPGVGAYNKGMEHLNKLNIIDTLEEQVFHIKIPLLGICLGMQLFSDCGMEYGNVKGLGWIKGKVVKFEKTMLNERIPHVGWNEVIISKETPLFDNVENGKDFYFVHSYHFQCSEPEYIISSTPYCGGFVSAVQKDNIYGVQFHPEKSQKVGFQILKNFLSL